MNTASAPMWALVEQSAPRPPLPPRPGGGENQNRLLLVLRVEAIPWLGCRQRALSGPCEMLTSWKYMGHFLNPWANEFGEQN